MLTRSIMPGLWHTVTPLYYGCQDCEKNHSFGPAIRDCYLLHYVFDGCGILEKEDGIYPVGKGELFVILPNEMVTYTADAVNPWSYCWLAFRAEQPLPFLTEPVVSISAAQGIFHGIRECLHDENPDSRIFSLTYELLWQLSRRDTPRSVTPGSYAAYAKLHLENTYTTAVTIESIANTLHIDRRYLTSVFRKTYGFTPQQYLMQLRLEKAKAFLEQGFGVTAAASMAGFSDLSNFSRKYKQHYGISPRSQHPGRK